VKCLEGKGERGRSVIVSVIQKSTAGTEGNELSACHLVTCVGRRKPTVIIRKTDGNMTCEEERGRIDRIE